MDKTIVLGSESSGNRTGIYSGSTVQQYTSLITDAFDFKDILEDEQIPLLSEDSQSKPLPDEQLWGAPFRSGLRPCVKPTAKYKDGLALSTIAEHSLCIFAILDPFYNLVSSGVHFTFAAAQGGDHYITAIWLRGAECASADILVISDMVAVARIMNATLVIPQLDKRSFWQDTSTFSDIFDELHFITSLKEDVRIVKELPKELQSVPRARKHFTSWSGVGYYEEMTQLWKDYQAYSRVANNDLPLDIQRLRCRALYHSLRFSPPIENLGKKLVERLRSRWGRYIALHLRYEKDMLSFTGCTYGLTDSESEELRIMSGSVDPMIECYISPSHGPFPLDVVLASRSYCRRNEYLRALMENTNHWKIKKINSTEQRIGGFCPLTPKEVGIFLQALGYPASTLIYVAAGEIYGGSTHLSELTSRFPNVVFKEMIATQKELKEFANHATQTAALDYIISIESDVFIPSYSGNMARAVEGHRRFLGHLKTITPDRRGLVEIFDKLESGHLKEDSSPSYLVKKLHKNR
ncbi:hypothetical protein LguiB_032472 [Lonicera macranthoides]